VSLNSVVAAVFSAFSRSFVIWSAFAISAVAKAAHMHETAPAPGVGFELASWSRTSLARKLQTLMI
jgi:hypothetical protein